jgi:hypothetical protein
MKLLVFIVTTFILILSAKAQTASSATAMVSAQITQPAILSMENNIIEGPLLKKTSGLQSAPFIWLNKRVASFYVEASENSYSITALTDNAAIDKLEVVEGKNDSDKKLFRIVPVFSGRSPEAGKSNNHCRVIVHFN